MTENIPNQNQELQPTTGAATVSKPLHIALILVLIVVVVAAIVSGVMYRHGQSEQKGRETVGAADVPLETTDNADGYGSIANTDVVWRGTPSLLSDLKLVLGYKDEYNPTDPYTLEPKQYYDLGMHGENRIILAVAPATDPGGPQLYFFEETPNGYVHMSAMATGWAYNETDKYGYELSPLVIDTNETTFYKGIVGPTRISFSGLDLRAMSTYAAVPFDMLELDNAGITKIGTVPDGDLYKIQAPVDQFLRNTFELKLPSGLSAGYDASYDFFSDTSVPNITWSDGSKNADPYNQDANLGGCGHPGAYITAVEDLSTRVEPIGTTNTGESIYGFKSLADPIVAFFYALGGKRYDESTGQFENISLEEWFSHKAVVVYKNSLGDYVIFTNENYGSGAECGKPVIYLYPTETKNVSVQVAADVTKSEPAYNDGWKVQAEPHGKLTMSNGETYDSLFWEGLGHGPYPDITEGTIVKRDEVEQVLWAHLAELGLNKKESTDFMEFWISRMPDTPFVRLTWFTTAQLDTLAPLFVSPRPDTTIRVFLDFQGLQELVALPKQKLNSIPRIGFTLVEWGGILRE